MQTLHRWLQSWCSPRTATAAVRMLHSRATTRCTRCTATAAVRRMHRVRAGRASGAPLTQLCTTCTAPGCPVRSGHWSLRTPNPARIPPQAPPPAAAPPRARAVAPASEMDGTVSSASCYGSTCSTTSSTTVPRYRTHVRAHERRSQCNGPVDVARLSRPYTNHTWCHAACGFRKHHQHAQHADGSARSREQHRV